MTEIPTTTAPSTAPAPALDLITFADAERVLAERLPAYESRPGQQRLAAQIETHIATPTEEPVSLLAEAPCGVGKSLGYLIPAILSGQSTCVSVSTKALQDQLQHKDLPFLQENLGVPFTWAILKGRGNYFCGNLAEEAKPAEVPHRAAVLAFAEENPLWDGQRETLPFTVEDREWNALSANSEGCQDAKCREDDEERCYATRRRQPRRDRAR
jgi:ATP-dependent DNA helicase DinG